MKEAEEQRAPDRALVDQLFNGWPPWTAKEEKENNILVNVNFREGTNLLHQARRQYENAFLKPGRFFTVTLPDAPQSKRREYETIITNEVNALMKGSGYYQNSKTARAYLHTLRSQFAGVCLHGIGPTLFEDQFKWCQFPVAMEDLLIPTDTELTLENLTHFAVRRRMTQGQLIRKTVMAGKNMDPGWQLDKVRKILDANRDLNQNQEQVNWVEQPERAQELVKQNRLYWESDAVPKIKFWDFYYQEEDSGKTDWRRVVILDNDCAPGRISGVVDPIAFVYQKEETFADSLDQILQIQFGDGNNVPPFVYHATRGLGFLLFDTVHLMNRLRCQEIQHLFEQLLTLYRCKDPSDRARLEKIVLTMTKAILPQDVDIVPAQQRFQVDEGFLNNVKSGLKQLMNEPAAAYTQDVDTGTQREQTATEVMAKTQTATSLTSSMLNLAYIQAIPGYQENCRRLTLKNSPDWDAKRFQNRLRERGVPDKWIDSSRWEIEPERVLGAGNKQLEIAEAQQIYAVRMDLAPEVQPRVMNDLILALSDNPKKANELAPLDAAPQISDTVHDTELVFAALMGGRNVTPKAGLNAAEVCEVMLKEMEASVQETEQSGGVGTPQDIKGFMLAAGYTTQFIKSLARDKMKKAAVKQYADRLGNVMSMVKAFAQRQEQAAQAQNGHQDPEAIAKLQMDAVAQQQKLAAKDAAHRQKMQHNQEKFVGEQKRDTVSTLAQIQRDQMTASADAATKAKLAEKAPSGKE